MPAFPLAARAGVFSPSRWRPPLLQSNDIDHVKKLVFQAFPSVAAGALKGFLMKPSPLFKISCAVFFLWIATAMTSPAQTYTNLLTFNGNNGGQPQNMSFVEGTDGNLYGTALAGGVEGKGMVFKITPSGTLTTLYSFCAQDNCADGASPYGGLFQATGGTFYGTTYYGGAYGDGTIFSLDMGLGPFVAFVRNSGKVGSNVEVLGQGFTGTTGVSFNGTPANFKVVSATYLTATVPNGATTGYVTVTTPGGTLQSNVMFRLRP